MRCFIGIDLPVEATKEIERLQRIIKPHFVGKATSSENLHLTLKFLGEIEDNTLNEISFFPRNYKNRLGKGFNSTLAAIN